MAYPKKGLLIAAAATALGLSGCGQPAQNNEVANAEDTQNVVDGVQNVQPPATETVYRVTCLDSNGDLYWHDYTRNRVRQGEAGTYYTDDQDLAQAFSISFNCQVETVVVQEGADLDDPNLEILKESNGRVRTNTAASPAAPQTKI